MDYPAMESAFHKLTTAEMAEKVSKCLPIPVLPKDPFGKGMGEGAGWKIISKIQNSYMILCNFRKLVKVNFLVP